jgi:hypothetical protein
MDRAAALSFDIFHIFGPSIDCQMAHQFAVCYDEFGGSNRHNYLACLVFLAFMFSCGILLRQLVPVGTPFRLHVM